MPPLLISGREEGTGSTVSTGRVEGTGSAAKVRRRTNRLLRHAFKFANLPFSQHADAFTAVVRCTSDDSFDSRTISKWARALRYVAKCKRPRTPLKRFMKEMGGVNACAAAYAKTQARSNGCNLSNNREICVARTA